MISTSQGPHWPVLHREKHGALVPKFPEKGETVKPADCFAASLEEGQMDTVDGGSDKNTGEILGLVKSKE